MSGWTEQTEERDVVWQYDEVRMEPKEDKDHNKHDHRQDGQ
jgi:hypothetical protein